MFVNLHCIEVSSVQRLRKTGFGFTIIYLQIFQGIPPMLSCNVESFSPLECLLADIASNKKIGV